MTLHIIISILNTIEWETKNEHGCQAGWIKGGSWDYGSSVLHTMKAILNHVLLRGPDGNLEAMG